MEHTNAQSSVGGPTRPCLGQLRAIRGVKAGALEPPLTKRVEGVRAHELTVLRAVRYLGGAQGFFWSAMPAFMVTATFGAPRGPAPSPTRS